MKKRIPPSVAAAIVVLVLGVCAFAYMRLTVTPPAPVVPKGANLPPPGTKQPKPKAPAATKDAEASKSHSTAADGKPSDASPPKKD